MTASSPPARRSGSGLLIALVFLLALGLAVLFEVSHSPIFEGLKPDSGLFAYTGRQILSGQVLYRDIWDEKPPAVYYLNALALAVGGSSQWTVWALSLAGIAAAAAALFGGLRRLAGGLPAGVGGLVFLVTALYPDYYQSGNFTEVYALLPQALTIGALYAYLSSGRRRWLAAAGGLTALAFLFKPTYIALGVAGLAVCLYLSWRGGGWRRASPTLGFFGLGFALPLVVVAVYFASQRALGEMLYAVFAYNLQYTQEGFSLRTLYGTFANLALVFPLAGLFAACLAAAGVFLSLHTGELRRPAFRDGSRLQSPQVWAFAAIILALPLEWAFVSVSGKNFGHYFLTPLPAMAAACACLVAEIRRCLPGRRSRDPFPVLGLTLLAVLGLAVAVKALPAELPPPAQLRAFLAAPPFGALPPDELEQYILDHSAPDQSVLVWGTHADLNFQTGRRSPTRFAFTLPLLVASPQTAGRYATFMAELQQDPPALIVAQPQASSGVPYFANADTALCPGCAPEVQAGLQDFRGYVDAHYRLDKQIWDWVVFTRID